ncbi:hypothetical protein EGH82_10505 [Vibrio ponticus]|uniref:Lipoprotein n=1 Tax=Vibrio ponticus TaxID=265668 RepID=A0A3N3E041_9VIBR|nr:hypothetical protein [Vibrio ponticus]ROV60104.1 hypothetical protein EGH82_10505 [Vibrio ponticus]
MKQVFIFSMAVISLGLIGCANEPALGTSVSQLKSAQVYNPNATQENLGYVPEGHGKRSQTSLEGYPRAGVAKKSK